MYKLLILLLLPISLLAQLQDPQVTMEIVSAQLGSSDKSQLVFEVKYKNNSSDTILLFRTARKNGYKNKFRFQTIGFPRDVFQISLTANDCSWEERIVFDAPIMSLNETGDVEKSYLTLGNGYEEMKLYPGSEMLVRYERTLSEPICPKTKIKLFYDTSPFAERQNFSDLDQLKIFYAKELEKIQTKKKSIEDLNQTNDFTYLALDHLKGLENYASKSTHLFNNYYKAIFRITPIKMESNELGITKK